MNGPQVAFLAPFLEASPKSVTRQSRRRGPGDDTWDCCRYGLDVRQPTLWCVTCSAEAAWLGWSHGWFVLTAHRSLIVEGDTTGMWHHQALWEPHQCPPS